MKKVVALFISCLLLITSFASPVLAAEIAKITLNNPSIDYEVKTITLTGTISSGAGKEVTILVTNATGRIVYVNQVTSAKKGQFAFNFQFDETNDNRYNVVVGGEGINKPYSTEILISKQQVPKKPKKSVEENQQIENVSSLSLQNSETLQPIMLDDFEGYVDNVELQKTYINQKGTTVTLDDSRKVDGVNGLKYSYEVIGDSWCGAYRVQTFDLTGRNALQLWVQPDGSEREFVIQFREARRPNQVNQEIWEAKFILSGNEPELLTIPFFEGDFQYAPHYHGGDGYFNVESIAQIGFYVNRLNDSQKGNGELYIDDIKAIYDSQFKSEMASAAPIYTGIPVDGTKVWLERQGIIVIEPENDTSQKSAKWQVKNDKPGYTGTGYYLWTGSDTNRWDYCIPKEAIYDTNADLNSEDDLLTYYVNVEASADYTLNIRNIHQMADGDNDVWYSINDSSWVKFWDHDANAYTWDESSSIIYLSKGINKLQLAGRARGYGMDRIVIHRQDVEQKLWTDLNEPESPCVPYSSKMNTALRIDLNKNGIRTETTEYNITGTVNKKCDIVIKVNDQVVEKSKNVKGEFLIPVVLKKGVHVITIEASAKGEQAIPIRYTVKCVGTHKFEVGIPTFTNSTGESVASLIQNQMMNISVTMQNIVDTEESGSLFVVLYDKNHTVKGMSYVLKAVPEGKKTELKVGMKLPEDIEGCYVKVFIWDSVHGLKPLAKPTVMN